MGAQVLDLDQAFGPENAAKLSVAYSSALRTAFDRGLLPEWDIRLAVVLGLLIEARQGRFDPVCLERTVISILETLDAALA